MYYVSGPDGWSVASMRLVGRDQKTLPSACHFRLQIGDVVVECRVIVEFDTQEAVLALLVILTRNATVREPNRFGFA